ncbi:MAG TPA: hypothetical protein VG267_15410 [Terracidiphilus sp.]|jgi:hypothetical protein|nr:hypothetical protein [Terracidiphilus sp.]
MARMIIHFLQITCFIVLLLILVDVSDIVVRGTNIRPPSVPLDREGKIAPYYDSPFPI